MKLAIVGSRKFKNEQMVRAFVRTLPQDWEIISGGAVGPDQWATDEARGRGMLYYIFSPRPHQGGYITALFQRNREIAYDCDAMVAFHFDNSPGTLDVIQVTLGLGKPVKVVYDGEDIPTVEEILQP